MKYKRIGQWFWRKKIIIGSKAENDRLTIFLPDGTIVELAEYHKLCFKLGKDWIEATKKNMEEESGQDIKLNV